MTSRARLLVVLAGLVMGFACVTVAYSLKNGFAHPMDRDHPRIVRGLYPPERTPERLTYAWSGEQIALTFPGLDRHVPWMFTISLRGARADARTLPDVSIAVDGVVLTTVRATNAFADVSTPLPTSTRTGATINVRVSNTFVPGPGDARTLGVMVDEVRLTHERGALTWPPGPVRIAALFVGVLFALAFSLVAVSPSRALLGTLLVCAGYGAALVQGAGPYTPYAGRTIWMAAAIAAALVLGVWLVERWQGVALRNTGRFVAAFSAAVLFLKLLVLLHPSMPIGDALFHAHRFEWVRDGRWIFTSVAPGMYAFPYAIGLYVFALPFKFVASNTADLVVLLRVIVAVADVAAGLAIYVMVARGSNNRLAAALSTAIFHLVPLNFQVQTVANLTNSFAQSIFVLGLAALVIAATGPHDAPPIGADAAGADADNPPAAPSAVARPPRWRLVLLTLLLTGAMLSHLSTFAILIVLLALAVVFFRWRGTPHVKRLAVPALLTIALVAVVLSIALYYRHFGDVYADQWARISGEMAKPAELSDPGQRSIAQRALSVPMYLQTYYGWPVIVLAVAGVATLIRRRHALALTLWAWLGAALVYLVLGVLTPVDMRHYLAAFPAAAILAGVGAARWWRRGPVLQSIALVLLGAAILTAVHHWIEPLR